MNPLRPDTRLVKVSPDVLPWGEISEPAVRMDFIVIVHPFLDLIESCLGIRYRTDADVVAFEGFHEGFGHAIALRAFDRGEAGRKAKRQRDFDSLPGGVDRTVVRELFKTMRRPN